MINQLNISNDKNGNENYESGIFDELRTSFSNRIYNKLISSVSKIVREFFLF